MSKHPHFTISLFDTIAETLGERVRPVLCNKPTLVHVSHSLEGIVLKNRLPALMFTGFQKSSYWAQETARYRELAGVAQQVCIFAGEPLPEDSTVGTIQVTLDNEDPLRQEWFVLILSETFNVLLCGKDRTDNQATEELRIFETLLSFEPMVLDSVVIKLEEVLFRYQPQLVGELRAARTRWGTPQTDLKHLSTLINDVMSFETRLNETLYRSQDNQTKINALLKHERDINEAILQASGVLIAIEDIEHGNILHFNEAGVRLLGLSGTEHPREVMLKVLHPDDYALADHVYQQIVITHEPQRVTLRMYDTQGEIRYIDWHANYLEDAQKKRPYFVAVGTDVTDRVQAQENTLEEERLRMELQKEREMGDVRLNFMVTIGHEFRTPLATILTNTELIDRHYTRFTREEVQTRLEKIKAQVAHMTKMLEEFQTLLEANRQQLRFMVIPTDVVELTQSIVQDVATKHNDTHTIQFDAPHWNEETSTVYADITLLRLILSNLLSNAMKFSPPDKPIVVMLERGEQLFTLKVIDQGVGIPKKEQKRIFEAFYRATNAAKVGGTGLGLALVLDAVKLYKGKITVKSDTNGTTFSVSLPLYPQS